MGGTTIERIAIVGAESTGKSWLAEALAEHYGCLWVPEYARQYLNQIDRPYTEADVEAIARGQEAHEEELAAKQQGKYLFCDTNLLVIKVWMDSSFGDTPDWIHQGIEENRYKLHIFTDDDIPYEYDPLREHPEMRDHFTAIYEALLEGLEIPYIKVSGDKETRLKQVISVLG